MKSPSRVWLRIYRRLAGAYPHEFRMRYGEDLDRMGEDAVPEAWRRYGLRGVARLLADVGMQLPGMYLAEMRQDVRYALRMLAKSPGFTAVAVLSVAAGIGMCCAVRSEIDAIGGPAPGLRDPAELATFHWSTVSYPYFERYREQRTIASATAFLGPAPFTVAFTADPSAKGERFYGHLVSPEYFSTLGVTAAAGRLFSPETEKPGMPAVVVVSDRFWRAQLGADPEAVGRRVRLNGRAATIVGIAPRDFLGVWPGNPADLFVPVTCGVELAPELRGDPLHRADREIFRVVFRLARGAGLPAAEAALHTARRNLDREYGIRREHDRTPRLMPAGTVMYITPEQRRFTNVFNLVLWGLVLALVCANLANLLLARGGERRREIALRLSVGASRARLVRQLLTESVLLSLGGGAGGIVLAYWITRVLSSLPVPSPIPMEVHCEPDLQVLAWTLAVATAAGVAFGLAPALAAARTDPGRTLKEGAQTQLRGYGRFGLRNLFVVCQMAASLMLVLVTAFVAAGFLMATRVSPGFETANLNLISLDPVRDGYSGATAAALLAALPDELRRVDGVQMVSLAGSAPFAGFSTDRPNTRVSSGEGRRAMCTVFREPVGAEYFATLGARLTGGREFDAQDLREAAERGGAMPAVLNRTAARALFGAENPIGRRIREGEASYTVAGVAADVPAGYLKPKPVATMFVPLTAGVFGEGAAPRITLLVRGTAGRDTLGAVRRHLATAHPELTVFDARTFEEELGRLNSFVAWQSSMFVILGVFALLLACIGLGGVTAYAVGRRGKEIGIRMALGARNGQVQRLVLREGTALAAAGAALGFAGAAALERALAAYSDMLARSFGQPVSRPLLMAGAPAVLAALAMLACYLPARRASRIDPAASLRED